MYPLEWQWHANKIWETESNRNSRDFKWIASHLASEKSYHLSIESGEMLSVKENLNDDFIPSSLSWVYWSPTVL